MQGRTALAALLVSAALCGCGQEARVAPARIEITSAPPPATAPSVTQTAETTKARRPRAGRVHTGTLKTPQSVPAPSAAAPVATPPAVARPPRADAGRFRASHLRALRAYCQTRPAGDPRCVDGEVDERVAFAFEEAR